MKLKLLDLFCGAGGAAMGYYQAGFSEIVGVDNCPQPHYKFNFVLADAMEFLSSVKPGEYHVIHASPPCQGFSRTRNMGHTKIPPNYIPDVRARLTELGGHYVIENVPHSPLQNYIALCGLHFGLPILRERWFEICPFLLGPAKIPFPADATTKSDRGWSAFEKGATHITVAGNNFCAADGRAAMGIHWMNKRELSQAIPPAYTHWIGCQLARILRCN